MVFIEENAINAASGHIVTPQYVMVAIYSTKIRTSPTGKSFLRWTSFFETKPFPVGPNRSIEFWTKISGNFGWMDRAQRFYINSLHLHGHPTNWALDERT